MTHPAIEKLARELCEIYETHGQRGALRAAAPPLPLILAQARAAYRHILSEPPDQSMLNAAFIEANDQAFVTHEESAPIYFQDIYEAMNRARLRELGLGDQQEQRHLTPEEQQLFDKALRASVKVVKP